MDGTADGGPRPALRHFLSRDGKGLVYYEAGVPDGRPVVLVHGHTLSARENWIAPGHMAVLAYSGYRVIAPDLRGHGASAAPHDAASYTPDVLTDDLLALYGHLGLAEGEFDVVGYSLGSRVAFRSQLRQDGVRAGRAAYGGMGLSGITAAEGRGALFRTVLANPGGPYRPGTLQAQIAAVLPADADRQALGMVIDTYVNTPLEDVARSGTPALVYMGDADDERHDGRGLAKILPNARYTEIPGDHMHAYRDPGLAKAVGRFLGEPVTADSGTPSPASATSRCA